MQPYKPLNEKQAEEQSFARLAGRRRDLNNAHKILATPNYRRTQNLIMPLSLYIYICIIYFYIYPKMLQFAGYGQFVLVLL